VPARAGRARGRGCGGRCCASIRVLFVPGSRPSPHQLVHAPAFCLPGHAPWASWVQQRRSRPPAPVAATRAALSPSSSLGPLTPSCLSARGYVSTRQWGCGPARKCTPPTAWRPAATVRRPAAWAAGERAQQAGSWRAYDGFLERTAGELWVGGPVRRVGTSWLPARAFNTGLAPPSG